MKRFITSTLLIFTISIFCSQSDIKAEELTESEFNELRKALTPSEDEPWKTIPWNISLLDAQAKAAKENKPIFIWAMDGHPLGCV